ncbi:hypothetical protein AB0M94_05950 [Streptomyces xanthochromogenes]|uniref:Uncharacterized protein n=1 Tax=Streptomyces xanthochromogenes TaxID=67384 RepID=A0ABQ2ZTI5_9ACTN|nr:MULTISPECIES: hypothetical protein [Streptomyces]GGY25112.1 hypothetical protein GCM10010326_18570 [Streptomyces xanthochromogenes]
MSNQTDTRPQGTGSDSAGKHRGGAASTEDSGTPAHGRHRREESSGANG